MPGEFLDEELLRCLPCSDLDEDCMRCKNADECDYCANGLKPHGPECETPTIAFCKRVDPEDYDKCLECSRGYSLTHDNSTCVNCRTLAAGCNSCDVDPFGRPTECTDCIGRLGGPACTWATCARWSTFRHGIHFDQAQCERCVEGYSRTDDGGCVKCDDGYGFWTSCTSCAVDDAHKPTECKTCSDGKVVTEVPGEHPRYQCRWPAVDHCAAPNPAGPGCVRCKPEYWLHEGACVDCGIEQCLECVAVSNDRLLPDGAVYTDVYPSCTSCHAEFVLVRRYQDEEYKQNPVNVCDWGR